MYRAIFEEEKVHVHKVFLCFFLPASEAAKVLAVSEPR